MSKRVPLKTEVLSEDSLSIEDFYPYMEEIDHLQNITSEESSKRFLEYTPLESESSTEFDVRRILDILSTHHEIHSIISPIQQGGRVATGLMIHLHTPSPNYVPLTVSLDFPIHIQPYISEGIHGCRFGVFGELLPQQGQILFPDVVKHLSLFFHTLPNICSFQDWQEAQASQEMFPIVEAYLFSPERLHYHFAADCIVRLLDWLKTEHRYVVTT